VDGHLTDDPGLELFTRGSHRFPLVRRTPAGTIRVEHGTDGDSVQVLEIHRRVLAEGAYFITEADEFRQTRVWKAAAIRELEGSENSVFLVARLDGAIVGALMAQGGHLRRSRHVARLEIFVEQAARGVGVGRALMDAVVQWAQDNPEVRKLSLNVFADNPRAIGLYESFGFAVEGRRVREYLLSDGTWRDDLVMALWLG